MANEIFIARQDTLENVQSTVNEIDANVDTANSTLGNFAGGGTGDSVVDILDNIYNLIAIQNSTLIPSDIVQKTILNHEVHNSMGYQAEIGNFSTNISGSVRIKCSTRSNNASGSYVENITIKNLSNNSIIAEIKPTSNTYMIQSIDIPVTAGTSYQIYIPQTGNQITYCNSCTVCATVNPPDTTVIA